MRERPPRAGKLSGASPQRLNLARQSLRRARALERQERYIEAAEIYRRVGRCPQVAKVAHLGLARCLIQMRRWSVVVSTLFAAVRRGVPRFPTMFEGGNVLSRAGRYEEAVRLYREAAGDPSLGRRRPVVRARLHFNTGYALAKIGRFFAAARAYRRCLEITPNDIDAWFNLGQVYREAGALKRAQQAFGRAAALDPADYEVWNNLGNVCAALEDIAGAEAAYRSALALKPDYSPAWNNLGNILQSMDRHADAINCYDRAIKLQGGGEMISYFNRALSLVSLGRAQEALRDLHRWAILPPWQGAEAHGPDWLRLLQSLAPPSMRQSAR